MELALVRCCNYLSFWILLCTVLFEDCCFCIQISIQFKPYFVMYTNVTAKSVDCSLNLSH